jgi:hypothetical protein
LLLLFGLSGLEIESAILRHCAEFISVETLSTDNRLSREPVELLCGPREFLSLLGLGTESTLCRHFFFLCLKFD